EKLPSSLFLFALTPWLAAMGSRASDAGADLTGSLLSVAVAHLLLRLLEERDQELAAQTYTVACVTFLSAALVTIKLSYVVGGATGAVALTVWLARRWNASASPWWRPVAAMIAGILLLGLPWMGRGVIMSGYIAYPCPFGRLPVDWRVPHAAVVSMNEVVRAWA